MSSACLAEAFRLDRPFAADRLGSIIGGDWAGAMAWLDDHRMALYFMDRVKALGAAESIPAQYRYALYGKTAENALRTRKQFKEFERINTLLSRHNLTFCNILGFALSPFACPEPALRFPFSTDLLLADTEADACTSCLADAGYSVKSISQYQRIFEKPTEYDCQEAALAAEEKTIKVYLMPSGCSGEDAVPFRMLMRRQQQRWDGFAFPAPLPSEHLISQAIEMYGKIGKGAVKFSSLFEFARAVVYWQHDARFWQELEQLAAEHPVRPQALGLAAAVSGTLFGIDLPLPLASFAVSAPAETVERALDQFGVEPSGTSAVSGPALGTTSLTDPPPIPNSEAELLERICQAYNKAHALASETRMYEATPWWKQVKQKHLAPAVEALRSSNIAALHRMYSEFFRDPCGKGLVRRPPSTTGDENQTLNLDEEALRIIREDMLYRVGYWRSETASRYPLSVLRGSAVGNPFGATIENVFVPSAAEYQHACAVRIRSFVDTESIVVELGGGFGHMACFLLDANPGITYIDFDVPESLALAAYYLGQSLPHKKLLLFGEQDLTHDCAARFDVILMPPSEMLKLPPASVDLTFSSHLLADLEPDALAVYAEQIARFTRGHLLNVTIEGTPERREAMNRTLSEKLRFVQSRRWDWNTYRAPEAREWEDLYAAAEVTP